MTGKYRATSLHNPRPKSSTQGRPDRRTKPCLGGGAAIDVAVKLDLSKTRNKSTAYEKGQ
jgi:hypothetical protein